MNTTSGPSQFDAANLSQQEREDARTTVQVVLGVLHAYRDLGPTEDATVADFERWVRELDTNLAEHTNTAALQTLPE